MQGVHAFDPKVKTTIDLESFVAEDHFLRRIDRVLDLSFIRELTAARYADGQGRPSIDPEVYFRMQLVAYFNGITKDRRLCEEVHDNLAYRWFCRLSLADDVPDHSSLTRIRDRLGEEVFEAVFRRIVAQCQQKGLVKEPVSGDDRRDFDRRGCVARFAGSQRPRASAERSRGPAAVGEARSIGRPTQAIQPDAPQSHRPRGHVGSKAGNALGNSNTKSIRRSTPTVGSFSDTEVTTGAGTTTSRISSSCERVRGSVPDHDSMKRPPIAATARRKSFSALQANRRSRPTFRCGIGRSGGTAGTCRSGWITSENTIAFAARRASIFIPVRPTTENHKRYVISAGRLPRLSAGFDMSGQSKARVLAIQRFVLRPDRSGPVRRSAGSNERADIRRTRSSERMWKCEGLFAEAKQYHCLARAKYRGRSKVQIQAYLCAIVQNLKRLLFPLYCWLLAHRWSYSTSTAPALPSNQSRPPTNC